MSPEHAKEMFDDVKAGMSAPKVVNPTKPKKLKEEYSYMNYIRYIRSASIKP